MSEKKDIKQTLNRFSTGFSTGTGLRLWLVFLFCFFFLGYPVPLCIMLSAAGGLAAGVVVGWWKSKDEPRDSAPEIVDELEDLEEVSRVSGLRLAKQRRARGARRRSQGLQIPFTNFLRR